MNEEVIFVIEGNALKIDQVLIDYNEIPVFYICKDMSHYYIVLCTDINQGEYYVIKSDIVSLYEMLNHQDTMRNIILKGNAFWYIKTGDSFENDEVLRVSQKDIVIEDLPRENAFYEICSKEIDEYKKHISELVFGQEAWERIFKIIEKLNDKEISKRMDQLLEVMNWFASSLSELLNHFGNEPTTITEIKCNELKLDEKDMIVTVNQYEEGFWVA